MKPKVYKLIIATLAVVTILSVVLINGNLTKTKYINPQPADMPVKTLITKGNNYYGQLGNGTTASIAGMEFAKADINNVKNVAGGLLHSVALKEDGTVWAWGENNYGQLGNNEGYAYTPIRIQGLTDITKIAVNEHHNLALDKNGRVWAWGLNLSGQLGDGSNTNSSTPYMIENLENVTAIAAGYRFSMALKENGSVWAWGGKCTSEIKQLIGQDPLDDYYDPVDNDILSTNDFNNCRTEDNVNILSLIPKKVEDLEGVIAISGGFGHMLALKEDGTVWGWGCNKYGQIGRGKTGNFDGSNTPGKIEGLENIIAISAGFRHSLALDKNGRVWAWGHNQYNELGTKDKTDSSNPVMVSILPAITSIAAGYDYSLAKDNQGKLWAWGQNSQNNLSVPDYIINSPTKLNNINSVDTFSAGGGHILVINHE